MTLENFQTLISIPSVHSSIAALRAALYHLKEGLKPSLRTITAIAEDLLPEDAKILCDCTINSFQQKYSFEEYQ